MTARVTLAQGKLGPAGLWIMAVVASSPLTVQVGGIPTMYAATGVAGVPLAFVLVGCVLFVLAVPYTGAAGHIRHAAPLYALIGRACRRCSASPQGCARWSDIWRSAPRCTG